jgi:hydrogenase nickel incorporation protein HypA/HybF
VHELSIALGIVDVATEEAEQRGSPGVVAIYLKVGPLSGVVPEALRSAFELARYGSAVSGAELIIEETPIVAHCPTCRVERAIASIQQMFCPTCGTATPMMGGRELDVVALEIES